jgi:hypothetical protein
LDDQRPESGDDLRPEHDAGRNFHVVTKFKILDEGQSLIHCDIAIGFEHHHRSWLARLHIANDELGQDIQTNLNIYIELSSAVNGELQAACG